MLDDGNNSHGKPICSICYEDLKPGAEDLQSISVCGHVFHELCLQQWFEYCSNSKKRNCPVCKQSCLAKDACRLYFQSVGNQIEPIVQQKVVDWEEDPKALRGEVKRLEVKVSSLSSAMESQKKQIKEFTEELHIHREQLKKEAGQKKEALREKSINQHLLQLKSEECGRLTSECARLQERNMDLAKELAALKLVSDLNLEEDEILKLASLGNEAKTKDTIDTLVKSLVARNRSYKELLAKCNLLGRGEARSSEKLEKATEKIEKLKKRVKELETILEEKDNEVLRGLKASMKCSERAAPKHPNNISDSFSASVTSLEKTESLINVLSSFKDKENSMCSSGTGTNASKEDLVVIDEVTGAELGYSNAAKHRKSQDSLRKSASVTPGVAFNIHMDDRVEEKEITRDNPLNKDIVFNIRKESPSPGSLCKPGDVCFSGGLLGPDGTNRYLGKWCKRGQSKGSATAQGSVTGSGDLIAVGADGRGGRVKVLRFQSQSSLDGKESLACAKRFKSGARTSNSQSQGLQIEHFFGRINR